MSTRICIASTFESGKLRPLCTAAALLEPLADAAREAAGVELKLHTRGKSEDGGEQAKALLDAAAAAADTVVLGTLTKVGWFRRCPCQSVPMQRGCSGIKHHSIGHPLAGTANGRQRLCSSTAQTGCAMRSHRSEAEL